MTPKSNQIILPHKPIFLIGFMGSGKSTLGRAVADATRCSFVDLDDFIEQRHNLSIRQIFQNHGEQYFRRYEQECLHALAASDPGIIACGGGTPCHFNNIDFMNSIGTTVLLDTPVDVLFTRLKIQKDKRPLIAALSDVQLRSYISDELSRRMPFYSKASCRFNSSSLEDSNQISQSVQRFVSAHFHNSLP